MRQSALVRSPTRADAAAAWHAGRLGALIAPAAVFGTAFATIASLAFAHGGYYPPAWGWAALWLLWIAAAALAGRSDLALAGREVALVGLLLAFVAWVALSALWSHAVPQTVLEVERDLIYVAGVLALFLVARRESLTLLLGCVLAAVALAACYGLATRLFPERFGTVDVVAPDRLASPLGYWNALAILTALGLILALGFTARAETPAARAVSAALLAPLGATLYLTFGRGPWVALAAGLVAAVLLDARRLHLAVTALVVVPPAALAVWLVSRSSALTHNKSALAAAEHDGHRLALAVVLLAALSAILSVVRGAVEARWLVPRFLRTAFAVVLGGAAVVAVVAALAHYGGPVSAARRGYSAFKQPPVGITAPGSNLSKRLFSFSGNGRVQLWTAALNDYRAHRVLGSGAGSFEWWWSRHRPLPGLARDAHSLYFEVLGELGPAGLALILLAIAVPAVALRRARRLPLAAFAFGAYVAWVVHAGVDWDWEMPAVTLAGLFCGAWLLVAARPQGGLAPSRAALRGGLLVAVAGLAAFTLVGLMGNNAISASEDALAAGNYAKAQAQARKAERWAPWSADPWRLLGDSELAAGKRRAAQASLRESVRKNPEDWSVWYSLALASRDGERRRALTRAARLNPLSPEVALARRETGGR